MASFDPVRALQRGLKVLRIVNDMDAPTLAEVTSASQLPKATVVRLLETLEFCGYIGRDPVRGFYFATGRTLELSRGYDMHRSYSDMAQPLLEDLRREIGWPLNLGCFDHDAMVIIYTNRELLSVSNHVTSGYRSPMAVTSQGRAFLAFTDPATREQTLEVLRLSDNAWEKPARDVEKMNQVLQDVRDKGYALSDPSYLSATYNSNIWAVAVPMMNGRRVELCLSAMVLSNAMNPEDGAPRILPALRRTAEALGRKLGAAGQTEEQQATGNAA